MGKKRWLDDWALGTDFVLTGYDRYRGVRVREHVQWQSSWTRPNKRQTFFAVGTKSGRFYVLRRPGRGFYVEFD